MRYYLELKRLYDRNRFFEFEFHSLISLNNFLDTFLQHDILGEKLELRIYVNKEK